MLVCKFTGEMHKIKNVKHINQGNAQHTDGCVVMGDCGYRWLLRLQYVIDGYVWLYVVVCGYMRYMMLEGLYVVICGYRWLYVVTGGYMWLQDAIDGYVWLCNREVICYQLEFGK